MHIHFKVAQLLASRLCHDLAGGISAIATGAELLAEEGGVLGADALALIASSAQQTSQRLQFLRVAFGQGGGEGGTIALHELGKLTHAYLEGGRQSLVWDSAEARIPLATGKLLLNLCLIATESLPRGGVLDVQVGEVEGRLGFAVAARGAGARLPAEVAAVLRADADPELLTPRNVHGHFAALLAAQVGAELEIGPETADELHLAALAPLA